MNIEAICLDMDGTILDANSRVSGETIELFTQLRKKGIKLFIVTGRTKQEMEDALPANIEIDGFVTANGMGCYAKGRKLVQHSLPSSLVREVVEQAHKERIYYEIHPLEGRRYVLAADRQYICDAIKGEKPDTMDEHEYLSRQKAVTWQIRWLDEWTTDKIVKVNFFSMYLYKIQEWKKALEWLQKKYSFTISSSSAHNAEISVSHVSKATGIKLLLDEYNLSKGNILAVGDAENDIPMFQLAGFSAAMKNANDCVKKYADEVTKYSYDENGLYHYLKETFAEILR